LVGERLESMSLWIRSRPVALLLCFFLGIAPIR
jgi:hypothetical protein